MNIFNPPLHFVVVLMPFSFEGHLICNKTVCLNNIWNTLLDGKKKKNLLSRLSPKPKYLWLAFGNGHSLVLIFFIAFSFLHYYVPHLFVSH